MTANFRIEKGELSNFKNILPFFQAKKVVFVELINDKSDEQAEILGVIESELEHSHYMSLPYMEMVQSTCKLIPELCESEELEASKNYIAVLRQSEFKAYPLTADLKLNQTIFKIRNLANEFDVKGMNFFSSNRIMLIFNYPNNQTVIPLIQKAIAHTNIHSFELIDFTIITGDPIPAFGLDESKNFNKIFIAVDQKILNFPVDISDPDSITQSVNWEINKNVEEFNLENYYRIFNSPIENKIFMIRQNDKSCPLLREIFIGASFQNRYQDLSKNRVLFVHANLDAVNKSKHRIMNEILYSLAGEDLLKSRDCTIIISGRRKSESIKYVLSNDSVTINELMKFIDNFNTNRLENKYYISEDPAKVGPYQGTRIQKIIGSTFKEEIIQNPLSDFLLVCKEMDFECESYIYYFEILSQKINPEKIRFCLLDGKRNEVPSIRVNNRPALLFYRKTRKHRPEVLLKKFSYANVLEFINQYLNRVNEKLITFSKEDQKNYLGLLSVKFPDKLASIKLAFDSNPILLDENEDL